MDITYFIRKNNNTHNEICDTASIKLSKNNETYYGGVQWGHHKPNNIIDFINTDCDKLHFNSWLNSLGYEVVIEEPFM